MCGSWAYLIWDIGAGPRGAFAVRLGRTVIDFGVAKCRLVLSQTKSIKTLL
jgi:hypothetical protein